MLMHFRAFVSLLAVAMLLCSCSRDSNRGNKIAIGDKATVHSAVLNEDRDVVIYLPPGYPQKGIQYPVVYMLDGDSHFHHASGITQFLSSSGVTAPLIFVGVGNTDRDRDLTPSRLTDTLHRLPTSGGGKIFLKFLTEELVPYMKSRYQVGPYKILVGHSLGGLFAVHTLISKPESFSSYIAISPSLWWNKTAELDTAKAFFRSHPILRNSLYMAVGDEGEEMIAAAQGLTKIIEEASPQDMRWKLTLMPNENHGSIVHRALYDGLEYTFSPLNHPPEAVFLDTAALSNHFVALSNDLGYTVVASERLVARKGFQFLGEKKIPAAIAMFQYNVRRFPDLPDAYDHLVAAYEQSNQLEPAIKNCELALEKAKKISDPAVPYYEKNLVDLKKKLEGR
jgi:predicted alpha/beta superfamily hydrolase